MPRITLPHLALAFFLIYLVSLTYPPASADAAGTYTLEVYNDTNYTGSRCYSIDAEAENIASLCIRQSSSLYIRPGWSVRVYSGDNLTGTSRCVTASITDLRGATFENGASLNDTISSFSLHYNTSCSIASLEVYTKTDYMGKRCWSINPETNNINDLCNEKVLSIFLTPGWSVRVYRDQYQGGSSRCFVGNDTNLADNTYEDGSLIGTSISSFVLVNALNCGGGGPTSTPTSTSPPASTPTPTPTLIPPPPSKTPLIFIPGVMGSSLRLSWCELWPGIVSWCGKENLQNLYLGGVIAQDAVRTLRIANVDTRIPMYSTLLDTLRSSGRYEEYTGSRNPNNPGYACDTSQTKATLFVFAYDWRQSNATNARLLERYITCIRQIHPNTQIDIITHSMGGLIARRYLVNNPTPDRHHVRRLITIAAPWLGAPKLLTVMETGWYDWSINALFVGSGGNELLKNLSRQLPGPQQLLPSRAYFDLGGQPLFEAGRNLDNDPWWRIDWMFDTFGFDEYISIVDNLYGSQAGSIASAFHTTAQDDGRGRGYGVDYYHFYGSGWQSDTIKSMGATITVGCIWTAQVYCVKVPNYMITYTRGDGTVPVVSASRMSGSINLNTEGAHIYTPTQGSREHTGLTQNSCVLNAIITILNNQGASGCINTLMQDSQSLNVDKGLSAGHYVLAEGIAAVVIQDTLGNSLTTNDGTLSQPIPDVAYTPISNRAHAAVFPDDQTYTVSWRAGDMPMRVSFLHGTGDTNDRSVQFVDIGLPIGTLLTLTLNPLQSPVLQYDSNGDGAVDSIIAPTADNLGALANDIEPPSLNIAVGGPVTARSVTLTASDASGVQRIMYSFDGTSYQIYSGPFQVDATAAPTIYAFADDMVANRTSLLTTALAHPINLPLSVR